VKKLLWSLNKATLCRGLRSVVRITAIVLVVYRTV
jgi:hypothetical protein